MYRKWLALKCMKTVEFTIQKKNQRQHATKLTFTFASPSDLLLCRNNRFKFIITGNFGGEPRKKATPTVAVLQFILNVRKKSLNRPACIKVNGYNALDPNSTTTFQYREIGIALETKFHSSLGTWCNQLMERKKQTGKKPSHALRLLRTHSILVSAPIPTKSKFI